MSLFPSSVLSSPLLLAKRNLRSPSSQELHELCKASSFAAGGVKAYSALTMDTKEWEIQEGNPCSGERLLLVFDRWRKLHKALYVEKKGLFDISKIPDIYDMAKVRERGAVCERQRVCRLPHELPRIA